MANNISKISDTEMQRQINRAVLVLVGQLEGKGLAFGKNKIGSVLKGHKHKYIFDNKLNTFRYYGLSKNVDFEALMSSIEKLIAHGYLVEKRPGPGNEKFADEACRVLSLTEKGRTKLDALPDIQPEEQNYTYNTDTKHKLDYSITEIVSNLRSKNESSNQMFAYFKAFRIFFPIQLSSTRVHQHSFQNPVKYTLTLVNCTTFAKRKGI